VNCSAARALLGAGCHRQAPALAGAAAEPSHKSRPLISTFPSSVNWRRAEFALGDALEGGPLEVVGSDMPLGLGSPAKEAVCDTVQSLRGSKPGTGTAVDISLPSIRNTRP
jgi:hypothetical protein